MDNYYLNITILENEETAISASDGVFSSIATVKTKEDFDAYCNTKADEFLNSPLGNYNKYSKKERKLKAQKWSDVKNLSEGKHKYYFNLESKEELFTKAVDDLAKEFGINYSLEIL